MCLFNLPVEHVSQTCIFCTNIASNKQLTIYQNCASTIQNNAMVLPFVIPTELQIKDTQMSHLFASNSDIITIHDMQQDAQFFGQMEAWMLPVPKVQFTLTCAAMEDGEDFAPPLQVVSVGGYKLSVARTLQHIRSIDKSVFAISDTLNQVLAKDYSHGFGFLICSFDGHVKNNVPLAYTTFAASNNHLFVPTRHEHGDHKGAHFDHVIFIANGATETQILGATSRRKTNVFDMPALPKMIDQIPRIYHVQRNTLRGMYKNQDFLVPYASNHHACILQ